MRRLGSRLVLAVVAVLAGSVLFVSGYSLGARTATTPGTPVGENELWAPFWDSYRAIRERYALGPVEPRTLVQGAISGMVESLDDRYSGYFDPEAYRESLESLSGQFEGIGAQVSLVAASDGTAGGDTGAPDATGGTDGSGGTDAAAAACATVGPSCRLTIVAPIPDAPAEKAGVLAGDVIVAIDGAPVAGLTVSEATDRIRGPKGTRVVLSLVRGDAVPFDLTIERAVVVQREVSTRTLGGGTVGYIRLTSFSDVGADQLIAALRDDLAAGRRKLILDLRGNPGGFITAAARVASQFIASGPVYWTQDASGEQVATAVSGDGIATDPAIRLVVLVDGGSASASEILAGALQDTGRATLVGQRTFGKGTIQGWQPLDGNNGGLKLTIAKWLTPEKRWIHGTGLEPDVVVPVDEAGGSAGAGGATADDPVLARALELLDAR